MEVVTGIGGGVPAAIELGYHLCYGSPADEHLVQPKDMTIMVEMANAISGGVARSIQLFHMPVSKSRTDDAYFAPLDKLSLRPETELYLGLIHYDDAEGDAARIAAARRHARIGGGAPQSGLAPRHPAPRASPPPPAFPRRPRIAATFEPPPHQKKHNLPNLPLFSPTPP